MTKTGPSDSQTIFPCEKGINRSDRLVKAESVLQILLTGSIYM